MESPWSVRLNNHPTYKTYSVKEFICKAKLNVLHAKIFCHSVSTQLVWKSCIYAEQHRWALINTIIFLVNSQDKLWLFQFHNMLNEGEKNHHSLRLEMLKLNNLGVGIPNHACQSDVPITINNRNSDEEAKTKLSISNSLSRRKSVMHSAPASKCLPCRFLVDI